jgi:hypothetical protein
MNIITDASGQKGSRGPRGPHGHRGHRGFNGLVGQPGPTGPTGTGSGADSSTGPTGPQGSTGSQGPTGPQGSSGFATVSVVTTYGTINPCIVVTGSDETSAIINSLEITPSSVTSSSGSNPENTLTRNNIYWMSLTDTGNPEWVRYDLGSAYLITGVFAVCGNGREGVNPKIQGSNDDSNWTTIHLFDSGKWVYSTQQVYSNSITPTIPYRYVRLHSDQSPYCLYDYIQYIGVH